MRVTSLFSAGRFHDVLQYQNYRDTFVHVQNLLMRYFRNFVTLESTLDYSILTATVVTVNLQNISSIIKYYYLYRPSLAYRHSLTGGQFYASFPFIYDENRTLHKKQLVRWFST